MDVAIQVRVKKRKVWAYNYAPSTSGRRMVREYLAYCADKGWATSCKVVPFNGVACFNVSTL